MCSRRYGDSTLSTSASTGCPFACSSFSLRDIHWTLYRMGSLQKTQNKAPKPMNPGAWVASMVRRTPHPSAARSDRVWRVFMSATLSDRNCYRDKKYYDDRSDYTAFSRSVNPVESVPQAPSPPLAEPTMPRRSILAPAERDSLFSFPEGHDEIIRHYSSRI